MQNAPCLVPLHPSTYKRIPVSFLFSDLYLFFFVSDSVPRDPGTMRSSIAAYKESLSRIANEVLDAADELQPPLYRTSSADGAVNADRRASRRLSHSRSPTTSPIPNGTGYASLDEVCFRFLSIGVLESGCSSLFCWISYCCFFLI